MYEGMEGLDAWDPRRDDFEDRNFNSYVSGPARLLVGTRTYGKSDAFKLEGPKFIIWERTKQKNTSLYVGGIPLQLQEEGLLNLFSRSGRVINVRIMRQPNPHSRDTYGFVRMASIGDAERAIRDMNGFHLQGFRFKVKMAFSDEERARRREEQQDMQSYMFNEAEDSDSDDKLLNNQVNIKENQPLPAVNGYGDHVGSHQPKGRGRGQVLTEITGSYGKFRTLPTLASHNVDNKIGRGSGPGGDNRLPSEPRKNPVLLPTPTTQPHMKESMKNLTITVDRENHRNLYNTNETLTFDSLNRGIMDNHNRGGERRQPEYGQGGPYASDRQYGHMTGQFDQSYRGQSQGRGRSMNSWQQRSDMYSSYPASQGGYGRGAPLPGSYPVQSAMNNTVGPHYPNLLQPAYSPALSLNSTRINEPRAALNASRGPPIQEVMEKPKPKPRVETTLNLKECTYCGNPGGNVCSQCKTPYCSRGCQSADWPQHKNLCKALAKEKDVADAFESKFEVSVGDELIPEVKRMMERATGDHIEVTKKTTKNDTRKKHNSNSDNSSEGQGHTRSSQASKKSPAENDGRKEKRGGNGSERRGKGQKQDHGGYETDIGADRRGRMNNNKDVVGYETDTGPERRACFNCGETNHVKSDCPKPYGVNSRCYSCDKVGHLSKDCPLKTGQNLQSNAPQKSKSSKSARTDTKTAKPNDNDWDDDQESSPAPVQSSVQPLAHSTPQDVRHKPQERSASASEVPKQKSIPVAELPLDKEVAVVITDTVSVGEIWLQEVEQTKPLSDTMMAMGQKFKETPCDVPLNKVKIGNYYGAKYTDGAWYRIRVTDISRQGDIEAHYIDFGNSEMTKVNNLRQLDSSMMEHSAMAIQCALDGLDSTAITVDVSVLKKYVTPDTLYQACCKKVINGPGRKIFRITLKNVEGVDVVKAILTEIGPVNKQTKPIGTAKLTQSVVLLKDIPTITSRLAIGQKHAAMFAYVPSPTRIMVQILDAENPTEIIEFDTKLQELYNTQNTEQYRPTTKGEVIVSKYSQDDKWYRAEVVDMNSGVDVVFFDFGNSETTSFQSCRKITPEFAKVERKCVPCYLYNIEIPSVCPPEIVDLFKYFSTNILTIEIKEVKKDTFGIELYSPEGLSYSSEIRDLLQQPDKSAVNESVKSPPKDRSTEIEAKGRSSPAIEAPAGIEFGELKLNTEMEVVPSDIVSLRLFHVRKASDEKAQQLASLMLQLNEACVTPDPYDPSLEEFVAAQFFDGEQTLWYRGQVLQKTAEGYSIIYVDYGNACVVKREDIRKLEQKFCSLPTMAIPCSLKGTEMVGNNEMLLGKFNIVLNKLVIVKPVTCVNGIYDVEMFLRDGTNLNSTLMNSISKLEDGIPDVTQSSSSGISNEHTNAGLPSTTESSQAEQNIPRSSATKSPHSNSVNSVDTINTQFATIDLQKISLSEDEEIPVITVHINNLSSFFVQRSDPESGKTLLDMMEELNKHCNKDSTPYSCKEMEYVAALFDEGPSKSWYRAQVMSVDDIGAVLLFIDYGNTDRVNRSDVRQLDVKFLNLPIMSVHCCLAGSDGQELPGMTDEFNVILGHPVNLKLKGKQGDLHFVEMFLKNPEKTNVNTLLGLDPSKYIGHVSSPATTSKGDSKPVDHSENSAGIQTHSTCNTQPNNTNQSGSSVGATAEVIAANASEKTSLKPPGSVLELGTSFSGAPMSVNSVHSFYFMLGDVAVQSLLGELMTELNTECKDQEANYIPSLGEYVAAFYSENGTDELWYRGVVTEVGVSGQFKVHYIDYGNDALIETKHIKKLEDKFLELPAFSTHCKLSGCEGLGTDSSRQFKAYEGVSVTLCAKQMEEGIYIVDLFNQDNENIKDLIGGENHLNSSGSKLISPVTAASSTELVDQLPKAQTPARALPKKSISPQITERTVVFSQTIAKSRPHGQEFDVVITSPVRPNLFHCQCVDQTNIVALKLLSDAMKEDCEESLYDGQISTFEVGEMCCAKFEDGEWYRATILDIFPDNTVAVEYVDFGNRSEVTVENLRPVRQEYTELPLLAFRCSLHGIIPAGSSWSEKSVEEMMKISNKPLAAKLINVDNDVYHVELTDSDGVNIAQHLIDLGLAKKEGAEGVDDDKERMRKENELLRRQLEEMQSQMAKMKMNQ